MCIRAVLVQGPGSYISSGPYGDVSDHWDPHVRMGLEAERQNGDANKEDRYNPNNLSNARNI